MKTKPLAILFLVGALPVFALAGGDEQNKELARLQGTWRLLPDDNSHGPAVHNEFFIFDGDNLKDVVGKKVIDEFTVKIIPGKTPKQMDLIPLKEPNKGVASPAIYKIESKKLTICVNFAPGGKRPVDFTSDAKNRNIILVMEKVEKSQK
jgi:uncharacterized protein (TIGR03067 family)